MKGKKVIDVKVEEMNYPNFSIGDYEGKKVQFKGGLLGQTCRVKITRNRSTKKKAKFLELLEHSYLENAKEYCPNADICGGCAYQRVPYETELMLKLDMIKKLLEEEDIKVESDVSINRSPVTSGYRNKMEYTFGDSEKGGPLVLGLHKQGRFYELVDTLECNIVDEDFEVIRRFVQEYFRRKNADFYHKKTKEGLLRHLIVRKAMHTGQIMVVLVTTSDEAFDDIKKDLFVQALLSADTEGRIVSIYHVKNDSVADAVIPEEVNLIYGKAYIEEVMMGLNFRISPFSFFQPNVFAAEKLYQKAFDFAEIDKYSKVLDLYSGTGTITQIMASKCRKATGIEIVEEAVEKARENAEINEIDNIEFICGDVLKEIENVRGDYDIVVLDPPREGIHPKAIDKIIDIEPEKFVYISCNPKTQVRDIKIFEEAGYKVKKYQVFDQFVNSRHVEAIALLEK
ncbi:MAG: 23S rRNA (uracil(1939)-C(5))-methyltransferase RlmD [Anaerococcus sp.]|nr:23S rRNA (uracil(1939)-C(5))-methyltransferase RlmD [Peptoniphilaceae bacterium]MDY3055668.1 23S rRNA (uracil(1939)-C(5))-methyltransferase RlmD [Anaerococcus sp.]